MEEKQKLPLEKLMARILGVDNPPNDSQKVANATRRLSEERRARPEQIRRGSITLTQS